jgi:DHA2 family multidrug resistance protein
VRQRITELTGCFLSHGVSDPAAALHKAIGALGQVVKRQALVMSFSDNFAIIGVAAVLVLFALNGSPGAEAAGGH